jgi:hypothetical protein
MPVETLERVKTREGRLKKRLTEKGGTLEPAKLRAAKKRLRRAQRKRRKLSGAGKKAAAKGSTPS